MPYIHVTDTLREIIKTERKKRKIRGDDLSKDINKSPSYISQIERGVISTIKIDVLFNILKNIIELPENELPDYLNDIINENIKFSKKERKEEEWNYLLEYQFRQFPVNKEIIEYLSLKCDKLNISPEDLVMEINKNKGLSESQIENLENNEIFAQANENGNLHAAIKFNLPKNFVRDILTKKTKSINKINMEGILFNIFILEGKNNIDADILADQKIREFRFFTIPEKNEIVQDAIDNSIDLNSKILPEDAECNKLINEVSIDFAKLRDFDPVYGIEVFSVFKQNLKENKSLTYDVLKLEFYRLSKLSSDRKREFLEKIKDLIDLYDKSINKKTLFYKKAED